MEDKGCCMIRREECREKCLYNFIGFIEQTFENHGARVARQPLLHILVMFFMVSLILSGFIFFRQEKNPLRLWIPKDSEFYTDTNWLMDEFGEGLRPQSILITSEDNVLKPNVLKQLLDIHVKLVNSSGPAAWEDVCFKVPIISFNIEEARNRRQVAGNELSPADGEGLDVTFNESFFNSRTSNSTSTKANLPKIQQALTDETFDPSMLFGRTLYCNIVKNMVKGCLQQNILDLWSYNKGTISNLTEIEIIKKINSTSFSPTLGHPIPFKTLLGGVTYDENGVIVSAKALLSLYMVHVNFSAVDMDEAGNAGGTADWANGPGLAWESRFLDIMKDVETSADVEVFYEAGRSFGDISSSGMFQDMDKLIIGIILMLIYIQGQQTRSSCVTSRVIPSIVGLLCIGLAFLAACGFCSFLGIPYGPVHTSLPFLLLGIGVDDMFVILSCWDGLSPAEKILPVPQRMGRVMRHAGLSITITSATDFVAFMIGSSTILPSLQSFCLYAAVGVLLTFFLQATVFVAALAIDQRRLENGRNFLLPFFRHTPSKHIDTKNSSQCSNGLKLIYSKYIMCKTGKVIVLFFTAIFLSVSFMGNLRIKQEFRPEWFLDQQSYLYKFLEKRNEFFPDFGNSGGIYLGQLHYSEELQKIGILVGKLHNQSDILMNVEDWWSGFHRYVNFHHEKDIKFDVLSDGQFNEYISQYLFSPSGSRYQKNFRFVAPLECDKPASSITVASIEFFFRKFESSAENVIAMNKVRELVRSANFTTGDKFATVWAKVFANWVTDEVIAHELLRNILLAILAVGITTTIFLGREYVSVLVLLCVLLTLANTTGFMHFWGLSIDLVSSIALVLAVGLCVDFAAHIAYAFMSAKGTRDERAVFAVSYIGGAVLHGGITTLLALSVLVFSHSYIFSAFFKIFLLVILMGLFHGLVFLPVVLSIIGPKPYPDQNKTVENEAQVHALENLTAAEGHEKEEQEP